MSQYTANPFKYKCKVVLLGEVSVGKTSLVLQYTKNRFDEKSQSTIGAAYITKTINIDDETLRFDIWDTAGAERYHSIAPMYYRKSQAAIIVYDITKEASYIKAKEWIGELRKNVSDDILIALTGNKLDLEEQRRVNSKEVEAYAKQNNLHFCETSAKSGKNIEQLFLHIATHYPKKTEPEQESQRERELNLTPNQVNTRKKCCGSS